MAITPKNIIKTYFEKGDYPTQAEFYEWMDSFIHMSQDNNLPPGNRTALKNAAQFIIDILNTPTADACIGIGTQANPKFAMIFAGDSKPIQIPMILESDLAGVASPEQGMMYYVTDKGQISHYYAGAWRFIGSGIEYGGETFADPPPTVDMIGAVKLIINGVEHWIPTIPNPTI